jgi:hypothetical protein
MALPAPCRSGEPGSKCTSKGQAPVIDFSAAVKSLIVILLLVSMALPWSLRAGLLAAPECRGEVALPCAANGCCECGQTCHCAAPTPSPPEAPVPLAPPRVQGAGDVPLWLNSTEATVRNVPPPPRRSHFPRGRAETVQHRKEVPLHIRYCSRLT